MSVVVEVAECGGLRCQRDSYSRSLSTVVVSCMLSAEADKEHGPYTVQLANTVLFPEGGGQPDDRGTVGGMEVKRVLRRGSTALHFLKGPVNGEVEVKLDWDRRFDHMQQHSGQHLITAIMDREYAIKTTSWNLAVGTENKCFVELATKSLSSEQIERVEVICNKLIRQGIPMTPHWCAPDSEDMATVRSRGLPDDFAGCSVRVVEIEGVDINMCCGTHVSSLAHLQCVKLLYGESRKGSTHLHYMVGGRVLGYTQRALDNERALTRILSVGLSDHFNAVEKLLKAGKAANRQLRSQLKEIAQLLVFQHLHSDPVAPLACIHRDDGDVEFMNTLANQLTPHDVFVMVTVGADKGCGQFLLAGKNEDVSILGPIIATCLDAKGGGRKGRFQGKAQKLEKRRQAETILNKHFTK